jgi:hypothetical protein
MRHDAVGPMRPLLNRTGQGKKLWLGFWVGLLGQALLVGTTDFPLESYKWTASIGMLLTGWALVWPALTIRCPTCNDRLLVRAAQEKGPVEAFAWLRHLEECPVCSSAASDRGRVEGSAFPGARTR